jgi:polyhydroxyalkanoate synthase subunit PhaC
MQSRTQRMGPRPVWLHLGAIASLSSASLIALGRSNAGSSGWKLPLPWAKAAEAVHASLQSELAQVDRGAFASAVARQATRLGNDVVRGILAYRRHPYARDLPEPRVAWTDGATRLLDYGGPGERPLLVVPSLINRSYVLDLTASTSLMRALSRRFRPFLVDWGAPGPVERGFDLGDYVLGRLGRALGHVAMVSGRAPVVVGYCMGGTLAVALAAAHQRRIAGLALLAAPWDFHAEGSDRAALLARCYGLWRPLIDALGEMPVDLIQTLFFALDPAQGLRKFRNFATLPGDDERARTFVALEDWLNDGVGLPAKVARECLEGWYGENAPARGTWRLRDVAIKPARLDLPTLVVVPAQDRIVPPASAAALAQAIKGADVLQPPLGHIGMVVGARAPALMWRPLMDWLDRCIAGAPAAV